MDITKSEVIRYLGYRRITPDESMSHLIDECIKEVLGVVRYQSTYRRFKAEVTSDTVTAANFTMKSKNLAMHIKDCKEIIIFAATLGVGVDNLLRKYQRLNMTKACIIQAVGAAAIEDYCDYIQKEIATKVQKEGLKLRPRFSPGYGDLALDNQTNVLAAIEASKYAGINLTEGNLMLPEKSVSAIIGLTKDKNSCNISGCGSCNLNKSCDFRR